MVTNQLYPFTCAVLAGVTMFAGPLDKARVAENAKWVVHLDMDAFRQGQLGTHLITQVLQPKLDAMEPVKKLELSVNLQNISGITAYGPAFEKHGDGVLLISTTADIKKDLDKVVGMAALSDKEEKDVTMVQQEPYLLYNVKNQIFVAPNVGNTVLVAKSREQIESAREVVLGNEKNLTQSTALSGYPETANTFFFLGMAEGFNEKLPIPPQAQVLRETRGGRLVIGEKEQDLFVNLVFKGKDAESATKIQQVFQGIIALVSLTQNNKELTDLAAAAKISAEEQNVILNLQIPVAKAIKKIDEHAGKQEHKDKEKDEDKE